MPGKQDQLATYLASHKVVMDSYCHTLCRFYVVYKLWVIMTAIICVSSMIFPSMYPYERLETRVVTEEICLAMTNWKEDCPNDSYVIFV